LGKLPRFNGGVDKSEITLSREIKRSDPKIVRQPMRIDLDGDDVPVRVAQPKARAETRFRRKEHNNEPIVFESPKHGLA
jgi:hypothetical protein